MKYWLMKSEPDAYGIAQLKIDGETTWDGIRNYQVRNMLRDDFAPGDLALFYHSNAGKETGVVGVMKVISEVVVDQLQFDPKSEYYDKTSPKENPRWVTRKVAFVEAFPHVVTLALIKSDARFATLPLVQKGSRLSVMSLSAIDFKRIVTLARV